MKGPNSSHSRLHLSDVMGAESARCVGLLLGLCAGDRNGGPQRMALRVAEAFAETLTLEP